MTAADKANSLNLVELENIQASIAYTKSLKDVRVVKGKYKYFHYNCDFHDDIGWGCGYRTTQMICSWINEQILYESKRYNLDNIIVNNVPTVLDIQKILVQSGDKDSSFLGSREWIGCFETSIVIDTLYNVPCKILHCSSGELVKHADALIEHFKSFASPIAVGGDLDNASKGILGVGVSKKDSKPHFLVTNPHFVSSGPNKLAELFDGKWIEWRAVDSFDTESFYNLCLPQLKAKY